ncbi:hypothetical protein SK128_028364 [Halocaridina rubra]|uniref:Glutamyl-tRNA(Gln) amidotransferase subunit B, mitochondrial n=1 Tax=Halocaridina rubra TaxID=373956 RepID=A0AAN8WRP5_HALRR
MRIVHRKLFTVKTSKFYSTVNIKPALYRNVWRPVIGLEVHAQILSASKLFSRVCAKYGAPPNTQVGIFEAAHPGTLPVLNKRCVEAAINTALALQAQVNKVSRFDRKHYFYPDLPAGYQITQKDCPIASNGRINFIVSNPASNPKIYHHSVRLVQLQLEEDSGKSIHDAEFNRVLVDLNRAGLPLMELVFAPELHDGEEAAALVKELSLILSKLGTCSCKMEEGALRVDANISVHKESEPLGERTEVKNLNSIRSLVRAINYEIERQVDILEGSGMVVNETRRFDNVSGKTIKMRDKDTIHDYRFMPEPNLPPLWLYDSSEPNYIPSGSLDINVVRKDMKELPEETRQRLMKEYGISLENAMILVNDNSLTKYFTAVMAQNQRQARLVCNLLLNNLLGIINSLDISIENCPMAASSFGEVVDLLQNGLILHAIALKIIHAVCVDGDSRTPTEIVLANNWSKFSDELIDGIIEQVIKNNFAVVEKYRRGKKKVFKTLMGKAVAATESRADMQKVNDILKNKLDEE